jgi:tryptophan synthase alpha chain
LPARDPFLESGFIAARMAGALKAQPDYGAYFEGLKRLRLRLPDTKLILLAYESTVKEIGARRFVNFCLDNGMRDIIFVGAKDDRVKNKLIAAGLRVSCYVRFFLDDGETERAASSDGFVYLQAKPDGGGARAGCETLASRIKYLRQRGITREIYCGVGIHTPADVCAAREAGADGVFIGSAILKLHGDAARLKAAIGEFRAAAGAQATQVKSKK